MSKVEVKETYSLLNAGRIPIIIVLGHQEFCVVHGTCHCTEGVPGSIHIGVGNSVKNIDAEVLGCLDARNALKKGRLQVSRSPQVVVAGVVEENQDKGPAKGPGKSKSVGKEKGHKR